MSITSQNFSRANVIKYFDGFVDPDEYVHRKHAYLRKSLQRLEKYLTLKDREPAPADMQMRYKRAETDYLELRQLYFQLRKPMMADFMDEIETLYDAVTLKYCAIEQRANNNNNCAMAGMGYGVPQQPQQQQQPQQRQPRPILMDYPQIKTREDMMMMQGRM